MNIKEDNMKILIRNIGCDDETLGLAYFEDADDLDFSSVFYFNLF